MPSPRGLTLPGPARELWLQTRDVIRRAMEELGGGTEYKLGGGTSGGSPSKRTRTATKAEALMAPSWVTPLAGGIAAFPTSS